MLGSDTHLLSKGSKLRVLNALEEELKIDDTIVGMSYETVEDLADRLCETLLYLDTLDVKVGNGHKIRML